MTRGLSPLVLTASPHPARYLCSACREHWDYAEVRRVLCCPECGGGLLSVELEPAAADTPPPLSAIT